MSRWLTSPLVSSIWQVVAFTFIWTMRALIVVVIWGLYEISKPGAAAWKFRLTFISFAVLILYPIVVNMIHVILEKLTGIDRNWTELRWGRRVHPLRRVMLAGAIVVAVFALYDFVWNRGFYVVAVVEGIWRAVSYSD